MTEGSAPAVAGALLAGATGPAPEPPRCPATTATATSTTVTGTATSVASQAADRRSPRAGAGLCESVAAGTRRV